MDKTPTFTFFCWIFVSSFVLYILLNKVTKYIISVCWLTQGPNVVKYEISMRIVSSSQAIIACLCGAKIVTECYMDKLHAKSWLVEPYGVSMTGYLWYDTGAMFTIFQMKNYTRDKRQRALWTRFYRFVMNDPAMMVHHILLPVFLIPILLIYRRGIGDFYIGMFLFIEAFIPFSSLRDILILLNQKNSTLYIINGFLTVIIYTLCRICIFPCMLWIHGQQIGQPFYYVPWYIPRICNTGSLALVALFVYWWRMVLGIMYKELSELRLLKSRRMATLSNPYIEHEDKID